MKKQLTDQNEELSVREADDLFSQTDISQKVTHNLDGTIARNKDQGKGTSFYATQATVKHQKEPIAFDLSEVDKFAALTGSSKPGPK